MALQSTPKVGTQAFAVVTGSLLSGAMMGISLMTIRVFLDTDTQASHLLQQWVRLYHYGHQVMPSLAIATCGLYSYITISKRASHRPWLIYALAAVTTVSVVPFTWIVMAPTNNSLFQLDAENQVAGATMTSLEHVQELVTRWGWLHGIRSSFPIVGAALGFTGVLREIEA
ncbi:DUF1772-domain-containing protein [Mollisia scopiformis]|uniref:DUF1772-domain-containing protein n=1 Tax=Mollisia scopiformis TaxID=149040 RepID=A0A194X082_MOLSC|nr:DUF1772-domain-containing protein [Mollisia scopiformis]KUJ13603.1 DUF1772-domain-containing protein [Mollisia scopiformis]